MHAEYIVGGVLFPELLWKIEECVAYIGALCFILKSVHC